MKKSDKPTDAPQLNRDDGFSAERRAHPFRFQDAPQDPLNERIVESVNRMGGVGREAEAHYQAALEGLRPHADAVVAILAKEYHALPQKEHHLERWALLHLLAELKNPKSLPFLDEVLSSPLPPEEPHPAE